jgi:hypothetical protein
VDTDGKTKGTYIVSACNEVVNFTNMRTGEIEFKLYEDEAIHGFVTCLAATAEMIAIGFSSGTVLVYSLKLDNESNESKQKLQQLHSYSFHRSAITTIVFYSNDTCMATGSSDTYIVVYDLVADTA